MMSNMWTSMKQIIGLKFNLLIYQVKKKPDDRSEEATVGRQKFEEKYWKGEFEIMIYNRRLATTEI